MSIPQGLIQSYGFTQTLFMRLERRLLLLQDGDKKKKKCIFIFQTSSAMQGNKKSGIFWD